MTGLLEAILRRRYGEPNIVVGDFLIEYRWNEALLDRETTLYKKVSPQITSSARFQALVPVYGDVLGGFFRANVLKVAMLDGPKVFGLYRIEDLQARPEVQHANSLDPTLCFFMDSANVWYYAVKGNELFAYDSQFDELDSLGEIASGLDQLLTAWERAEA